MKALRSSETSVTNNTHDVTSQKTFVFSNASVRTSNVVPPQHFGINTVI